MNPSILTDPREAARALVAQRFLAIVAVGCGCGALLVATSALAPAERAALAGGFVLVSAFALANRRRSGAAARRAVLLANIGVLMLVAASAALNGFGMNAPATGFMALLPLLMAAVVGTRVGVLTGLASVVLLAGLAWAEHAQWIGGVAALADMSLPRRIANHLLLVGVGLASGLLVARVLLHYMRGSDEREARFVSLLGIAVDTYWEIDANFEHARLWARGAGNRFALVGDALPMPWEQPECEYDPGVLEAHLADLHAHRPFRNLRSRWRQADGSVRHELVSGEPRFDAQGRFLGYWGVTRNITEDVELQEALRRSETTLKHLVETSPDLITLTDLATGRYVMVNDAFTHFSGYRADEAIGRTSIDLGVWGDPAQRETFVRRIREDGAVKDLQVEFVAKSGRRFELLMSGASFELEGGRYLVLNGRDVTDSERTRLAHEAVLEQASLGIAFTRDGTFMQANPALEQMLGWQRGSLAGQPGRAVWSSDAEYAEIGALIGPALARGEPVEFVRELARRDGSMFWCRMMAKAVHPTHPMRGGTIWIVEDITERRRTEQALAKARDDAEAASRAKSAFLANTSHEIRTPLNGLVGLARLLRRPDLDEARRRHFIEQIGDSAETLSALISDVLDLSKIEAGKLDIERVAFDLRALLESLRRVYGTLADARGLGFSLQIDAAVPQWVWGDPVRLRQVLANYLNNALKFTPRGQVCLRAGARRDERLRFEVRDSGIGIEPEVQARLFTPFTQADESTTRRFGGSGLGLSICRELGELMGGAVGVHSAPGAGSCFWAELPLPAAAAPPAAGSGSGSDANPARLAGMRVLMVEDNPVNMMIAVAMLEQWGVVVTEAGDGAQAVAAVTRAARAGQPFQAVLMDVQMPVMSGYEATRRLRETHAADALPIIALTAAALTSERDQALSCGMSGFLTKPIDAQRLHDALLAAIELGRRVDAGA